MNSVRTAAFLRQLGSMLESGVPMLRALQTLAGCAPGSGRRVAALLRERVERGKPLHEAVEACPGLLTPVELALVRAGAESGRLDRVLTTLAERREAAHEIRRNVITKLIYPAILLHLAIAVGTLLAVIGPGGTPAAGIRFLVRAAATIYGGGFALYAVYAMRWDLPPWGRTLDRIAFATPIVGRMVRRNCLIRFCQAFESLYVAGVPHPRTLELAAQATGNVVYANRLTRALPLIAAGGDLGEALMHTRAFDAATMSKVVTGIQSGKLEEALQSISREAQLDARATADRLAVIVPTFLYLAVVIWTAYSIVFKFYINYFKQIDEMLK